MKTSRRAEIKRILYSEAAYLLEADATGQDENLKEAWELFDGEGEIAYAEGLLTDLVKQLRKQAVQR